MSSTPSALKPFSVYVIKGGGYWYVGSAWNKTTPQSRFEKHLSGRGNAERLWQAIQSGVEFIQETLESSYGFTQSEAFLAEERWISKYLSDVECGSSATCWTQIHGTDGLNVDEDFQPMRKPCSARYNGFRQRQIESTTPEERSESAKSMWAKRSSEERSAIARRAWETKRAKGYSGPTRDPVTNRFVSSDQLVVQSDLDPSISGDRDEPISQSRL